MKKALFNIRTIVAATNGLALCFSIAGIAASDAEFYKPKGYHIETIKTPDDIPFHITGIDSDEHGNLYVVTRLGQVWTYNEKTANWHKFADGLHEPTGLLLDNDKVLVAQKPELTQLVDTDNDNVAEVYKKLVDDWKFHDNYHEFSFGPVKDAEGNLYGTLNLSHRAPESFSLGTMGSLGGYRGWAYQVTTDGEFVPYAYGLRSPAGVGVSPNNEVFFTDNQGDWVETSKLDLLQKDKFYGHPISLLDHPDWNREKIIQTEPATFEAMREKPVAWIPHIEVANSPGNPEWDITKGLFGPFKEQIFIGDQTQSNLFRVILDKVDGHYQGAVINFMNGFQSGNIRTHFDKQGQLWIGQTARGWQAKGLKPFGLQKVVWDGQMPFELLDIKLTNTGFKLTFTEAIDKTLFDPEQIKITQWNYKFSGNYGSAKFNLETLKLSNVVFSNKGKTLTFDTKLTADKIVMIDFSGLKNEASEQVSVGKVYYTLNYLKP